MSIQFTPGQCVYPDCKETEYVYEHLCSDHQPGNEEEDDDSGREAEYQYRLNLRQEQRRCTVELSRTQKLIKYARELTGDNPKELCMVLLTSLACIGHEANYSKEKILALVGFSIDNLPDELQALYTPKTL